MRTIVRTIVRVFDGFKKFIYYCFIARIPIISGLILAVFPWIAQNGFPQFLKNLFAMENSIQIIFVMALLNNRINYSGIIGQINCCPKSRGSQ